MRGPETGKGPLVAYPLGTTLRPMRPWTLFLAAVTGWMTCRQQETIDCLRHGKRRLTGRMPGESWSMPLFARTEDVPYLE